MTKLQTWRSRLTLFIWPALIGALPFSAYAQGAANLEPVTMRFNWSFVGSYAPVYLGIDKGFYAEQGIDLKPLLGKGTVPVATAVANGSDDFGYVDMAAAARLIDKGLPLKGILQLRQKSAMGLLTLAKSNITAPRDLEGRTVGNTPGDSISQVFPAFVKANNIDITKVKLEGLDYSIYLKALINGQVDATMGYLDSEAFPLENQGIKTNFMFFKDYGVNLIALAFVTNSNMIKTKPDLVRRFVAATVKSYTYAQTHIDEAVTVGKKYFPEYDEKLTRRVLEFLPTTFGDSVKAGKPIGWCEPAVWAQSLAIMRDYMGIQHTDPSFYYTNEFIPAR
jgi:NitT/TauT family transport system substrate-binding protein